MGSRKKKPLQENFSPLSVVPSNEYGFLLSGSVRKFVRSISSGPTTRWNGVRGVRSVRAAFAPRMRRRSTRRERGLEGLLLAAGSGAENFSTRSEKFSE